jgi:hypothetical protein
MQMAHDGAATADLSHVDRDNSGAKQQSFVPESQSRKIHAYALIFDAKIILPTFFDPK